ncbi:MAG: PAS domain S-box protein [Syntrophales bacterium]|nr:PAS domain S-box protein [Syntrophales bacterium]
MRTGIMRDEKKTKAQLIRELQEAKSLLAEALASGQSHQKSDFLQILVDTIPISIFYKDTNGIYLGCNRAYETFLGLGKEAIVGKTLHEIFPSDLADKYTEMDTNLFHDPGEQVYEWQISDADGRLRDVIFSKATFYDERGVLAGLVGVMVDITERKKAEKNLAEAEERYRSIVENAVEGIFQSSPGGRILKVNPAHARMFGYETPQEMIDAIDDIGQGHYVHSEDRDKFRNICDTEGFIHGFEVGFNTKNKEVIWVSLNARAVRNTAGNILYYEGFSQDITTRVLAEKALRDSERLLSEIIDFLPDPTYAIDRSGRVLVWNKAIEDMTGVKAADMVGQGDHAYAVPFYGLPRPMLIDLLFKPDDAVEGLYDEFIREGDVILAESRGVFAGNLRVLWGKAAFLYDTAGEIVGGIESIRDITERRMTEEQLKQRGRELLTKTITLEEINVALKVLLDQREKDKSDMEDDITLNVQKLVKPYIEKLRNSSLPPREAAYIRILEMSLNDIVSPFANKLTTKLGALTPKEIEIAKLVKEGKTTKEIAELLGSSIRAIEFHRHNIRRKLDLKKTNKNLRSYLMSLTS